RITLGAAKRSYEIVGVVGFFGGYWARDPIPMIYLPQRQHPSVGGTVILRSSSALPNVAERARELLTRMPVRSHMSSATTLQAAWQATVTRPRARMAGMLVLALVGLVLGAQGTYALSTSLVSARRHELAVRAAL